MNSQYLQNLHWKVYKDFFAENSVVLSKPFLFYRSRISSDNVDWADISQQLPIRIYVWAKKISWTQIRFSSIQEYDLSTQKFQQYKFEHYTTKYEEFINSVNAIYTHQWLEVSIITELPKYLDMWFDDLVGNLVDLLCKHFQGKKVMDEANENLNLIPTQPMQYRLIYNPQLVDYTKFSKPVQNQVLTKVTQSIHQEIFDQMETFSHVYSEQSCHHFINTLKKRTRYNKLTQAKEQTVLDALEKNLWLEPNSCALVTSNNESVALLVTLMRSKRVSNNEIQELLSQVWWSLIYDSLLDWIEPMWLQIEQDTDSNIYHGTNAGCMIKIHDINGSCSLFNSLDTCIKKFDIVADMQLWKLYIGWEKVSSNEIVSQFYTSSVLQQHILLQKNIISSTEIPASSYSKSKSEFLWKIAYPLQKTVQEKLGKSIRMQCNGKGNNFNIILQYDQLAIWCIM